MHTISLPVTMDVEWPVQGPPTLVVAPVIAREGAAMIVPVHRDGYSPSLFRIPWPEPVHYCYGSSVGSRRGFEIVQINPERLARIR